MTDQPFSQNGKAGCLLLVCVTDAQGRGVDGLVKDDFKVHWLEDGLKQSLASLSVDAYDGSGPLADINGLYGVQAVTQGSTWSPLSANVVSLVVVVTHGQDHGRTIHKVTHPPT
jgi:hypothetical protein